ncbi:hypothetical protein CR513_55661, partial [Mucuna pruriens]
MTCMDDQKVENIVNVLKSRLRQSLRRISKRHVWRIASWRTFVIVRRLSSLSSKIKPTINYQEICQCPPLVNRYGVLDKVRVMDYKSVGPMKDEKFSD